MRVSDSAYLVSEAQKTSEIKSFRASFVRSKLLKQHQRVERNFRNSCCSVSSSTYRALHFFNENCRTTSVSAPFMWSRPTEIECGYQRKEVNSAKKKASRSIVVRLIIAHQDEKLRNFRFPFAPLPPSYMIRTRLMTSFFSLNVSQGTFRLLNHPTDSSGLHFLPHHLGKQSPSEKLFFLFVNLTERGCGWGAREKIDSI